MTEDSADHIPLLRSGSDSPATKSINIPSLRDSGRYDATEAIAFFAQDSVS